MVDIPAHFDQDRVFVRPVTTAGDTLVLYTDTGGGANMLYRPAVDRLGWSPERRALGDDSVAVIPWPDWREGAGIPSPMDSSGPLAGVLLVVPFGEQPAQVQEASDAGFLGRTWFADRVWTFDYPAGRLLLHPGGVGAAESGRAVALGFQTDSAGRRTTHFPRIQVVIAGDTLNLLFDTGATVTLTDAAVAALGDGRPARRAGSFLSAECFDQWRVAHPEWRVIEEATGFGAALIEVPQVAIAGYQVGPVWFERRPVGVFETYMSRWMDRPIEGALGGNLLGFFRVTIDYPGAVALFERPAG